MITVLAGGDHGGPSRAKLALPKSWDASTEEHKAAAPAYPAYTDY